MFSVVIVRFILVHFLIYERYLKKFRSTVYEYLIDKEKPEGELLSPEQVLHVIAKFFAYEVVFCEPLF